MSTQLRIIVTGLVGLYPVGGVAWDYLQYAIGFARMGHDVYYHEDTWSWPYHPVDRTFASDGSYSAHFIRRFFERYSPELVDRWHYQHLDRESFGMSRTAFDKVAGSADLFLNVSGACRIPSALSPRCVKAFVDTDPGYNQVVYLERFAWSENVDRWCDLVDSHDVYFTYAENIHGSDCLVPDAGFPWKTTRMPVVPGLWAVTPVPPNAPWTTVMSWGSFKGALVFDGTEFHSKSHEFRIIEEIPKRSDLRFIVAAGGADVPYKRLSESGWQVLDGPTVTLTPEMYENFLARSAGEVSIAKHVYVAMRSGWFSTRSACYLAAGRPVVVQDTGFSRVIPTGRGLIAFSNLDGALSGLAELRSHYDEHAAAAREVAQAEFDSDRVLTRLVDDAGSQSARASHRL